MSDVTAWIESQHRERETLAARSVEPTENRASDEPAPEKRKYCAAGFIPRCKDFERATCCLYDEDAGRWIDPDFRPCKPVEITADQIERRLATTTVTREGALALAGDLVTIALGLPSYSDRVVAGIRSERVQ